MRLACVRASAERSCGPGKRAWSTHDAAGRAVVDLAPVVLEHLAERRGLFEREVAGALLGGGWGRVAGHFFLFCARRWGERLWARTVQRWRRAWWVKGARGREEENEVVGEVLGGVVERAERVGREDAMMRDALAARVMLVTTERFLF